MPRLLSRLIQLLIIATPVVLFGWLAWQELVPGGTFAVRHRVGEASPFVDRLLPDARADREGVMTDEPAFFFVHPHRSFDAVEAEVWFQNEDVPIVELGGLGSVEAQAYDLKPLQNLIIDRLGWLRLEQDGLVLLQRDRTYDRVSDFLADPPPLSEIATYQASVAKPFRIPGYAPSSVSRTVDVSLRGYHEFKTYVRNETLSFDFAYMDMNRDEGADPVAVVVTDADGTPVADARASDDGNLASDARATDLRHVRLSVPDLPEGVYKVHLQSSRDIFWRTVVTPQQKLVFLGNLFLGDEAGYRDGARPVRFWTEAKHLSFATRHVEGLQTVSAGSQSVAVAAPYVRFSLDVDADGVVPVVTQAGDLEIAADGHVAFAEDMYFNPDPVRLAYDTDLDRLGVNYVLARYRSPDRVGAWYVARVSFDARSLVFDQGAWKFAVSAPGIKELGAKIRIGEINMVWKREPLRWEDVWGWLRKKVEGRGEPEELAGSEELGEKD